jgi:hypothetical protein
MGFRIQRTQKLKKDLSSSKIINRKKPGIFNIVVRGVGFDSTYAGDVSCKSLLFLVIRQWLIQAIINEGKR